MPKDVTPSKYSKKPKRPVAVAVKDRSAEGQIPVVTASGRGKIAESIVQLAFDHDIKVRTDGALADILVQLDLDSPIPTEAFMAVAEILSYVYRANGQPNPFDTFQDAGKD